MNVLNNEIKILFNCVPFESVVHEHPILKQDLSDCFLLVCQMCQTCIGLQIWRKTCESGFVTILIRCFVFWKTSAGCGNFNAEDTHFDHEDENSFNFAQYCWVSRFTFGAGCYGWVLGFNNTSMKPMDGTLWRGDKPDNPSPPSARHLCWAPPCKSQAPPTRINFKELSPWWAKLLP